jgi:hypothetical protein
VHHLVSTVNGPRWLLNADVIDVITGLLSRRLYYRRA